MFLTKDKNILCFYMTEHKKFCLTPQTLKTSIRNNHGQVTKAPGQAQHITIE